MIQFHGKFIKIAHLRKSLIGFYQNQKDYLKYLF